MTLNTVGRHPSIAHFGPLFAYEHLPARLQVVSKVFHDAAQQLLDTVKGDNPELATSLRKLLEAKDCAVRADGLAAGFRPAPLTEKAPEDTALPDPQDRPPYRHPRARPLGEH